MKNRIVIPILAVAALGAAPQPVVQASGVPEPGLVMYGAVHNTANANARLTTGTLTWTVLPPSGSPVTVSTALSDISGQFSYVLKVPFETVISGTVLSANTLQLNSAVTTYYRTNLSLSINGTNYPVTIVAPALGNFTFNTADRGRMEQVDLAISAPGIGGTPAPPFFASTPAMVNGKLQLTISGNPGQTYTILASSDLLNWTLLSSFVGTNAATVIYDSAASNYVRRFYRATTP